MSKIKKIGYLIVLHTLIMQVSCTPMTTNLDDFDGYGYYRWGSNPYTVWNAPISTLNESDSQCVTKSSAISIGDKVQEKISINCLEVMKLGKDRYKSKMFFQMLDNFFNSQTGMYFFASLLELL